MMDAVWGWVRAARLRHVQSPGKKGRPGVHLASGLWGWQPALQVLGSVGLAWPRSSVLPPHTLAALLTACPGRCPARAQG